MEKKQAGSLLQIRIDERLRYLTNLAAAATDSTLTEFVSKALIAAFENVSLYKRPAVDRVYGVDTQQWPEVYDPSEGNAEREAMILGRQADLLWSESAITRLEMLDLVAPHLLPEYDAALLAYVKSLEEYRAYKGAGWKLDRKKVDAEWDSIIARFTKRRK